MKLIPLNCRQCGAPLSVPEEVRHVTCLHCGTQLAVVREGAAAYTEILEQLERRTTNVEARLDALQRQHLVNQLDQDWYEDREQYYIRTKEGRTYLPSKIEAVFYTGFSLAIAILVGWLSLTIHNTTGGPQVVGILAATLLGLVGLGSSMALYRKRIAYDKAEKRYLIRRAELTEEG
ncbi:zinc ribbon domain-containing protein [Blastopirellula marina]|uniref:Zinc ribbon domain-containing protein n=1 Tax=Blastopirellula marina TaxID=124 RepID=A0A2S8F4U0_9BACT|nr:zinc ribbon domain-containing protein [Blastopirellula marina]PQO27182.1 hypothetical protein C5Y98_28470 [Blastopirellula marina]PTL41329.1 hypothetical protein C5Y97_28485 [Blastopirellula marina]